MPECEIILARALKMRCWGLAYACVILSFTWTAGCDSARANERILSFDSDIEVHQDGTMTVTETIRVRSERNQIKRGIYRDFPTQYKTRGGHAYVVDFDLIHVTRNGKSEPHHIKSLSNAARVYIGQENVLLSPGRIHLPVDLPDQQAAWFF